MRSQHFAALLSLGCFVLGAAIGLTASYGTRLGWWDYATGLKILAPGAVLAIAGSLSGGLWAARALQLNDSSGLRFGAIGLAGSLIVAFMPLNQLRLYYISPPIHDISTDPEFPPPFQAVLPLRAGALNGPEYDGPKVVVYQGKHMTVAAAQKRAYLDIRPYSNLFPLPPGSTATPRGKLFWHAYLRMQELGWTIAGFNEADGTIEATWSSFWFGLTSDICVRVKPAGRNGAIADIRAKSRDVENDMGMNARLVRSLRASL